MFAEEQLSFGLIKPRVERVKNLNYLDVLNLLH